MYVLRRDDLLLRLQRSQEDICWLDELALSLVVNSVWFIPLLPGTLAIYRTKGCCIWGNALALISVGGLSASSMTSARESAWTTDAMAESMLVRLVAIYRIILGRSDADGHGGAKALMRKVDA